MDLGQGSVGKARFLYPLHTGPQKSLGIPKAHLADGSADAADRGFKKTLSHIFLNDRVETLCLRSGQIDDVGCLIGCQPKLHSSISSMASCELTEDCRVRHTADRMPGQGIETFLFLLNGVAAGENGSSPVFLLFSAEASLRSFSFRSSPEAQTSFNFS